MGCCHGVHIVCFATGGASAVEFCSIPGGNATLLIAVAIAYNVIGSAQNGVAAGVSATATWFSLRYGVSDFGNIHTASGSSVSYL